ncbi:MAG: OmpH family outer membrane protein [Paludibacteraceae bacterium]|nr:OmpH family outer membrane protein [Paludibacteraceae bacterium]MBR1787517.1 OmpH family outer membrane protein [Paludibacteraceae bacterium]
MNRNIILYCYLAVLTVLVVVLSVKVFSKKSCNRTEGPAVIANVQDGSKMPVAYINLDTLLTQYTFAIEANDRLMSKQESARATFTTKARTLQNEMADFQRKLETNAFLSRDRAEKEQQRLLKKQQELEQLEDQLSQDILVENQKLNKQLRDTLDAFLKEYNANAGYQIILANAQSDNILLAQPGYDITPEVVSALNKRYTK